MNQTSLVIFRFEHKESQIPIPFCFTRAKYVELDFLIGAKAAFELSMTAIFNHRQLRAAEILEKQMKGQGNSTPTIATRATTNDPSTDEIKNFEDSLLTSDEKKVEEGNTIYEHTSVDKATSSGAKSALGTEDMTSDSAESTRQALQVEKDIKADLKDLNNDVKYAPDLEGLCRLTHP